MSRGASISVILVLLAFVAAVVLGNRHDDDGTDRSPDISISDLLGEGLLVTNNGTPEIAGYQMELHVNGDVSGYQTTVTAPAVGQSVVVPLTKLVKGEQRFNPATQAASRIWVGITMPPPGPNYSAAYEIGVSSERRESEN